MPPGPDDLARAADAFAAYLDDLVLPESECARHQALFENYLKPAQELDDQIHGRNEPRKFDPPGGWAPGMELAEDDGDLPMPAEPVYRQVNLKLKKGDYGELENAAGLYGLAPTTLARALVRRGSRAILAAFHREERLGMPPLKSSRRSGSGA